MGGGLFAALMEPQNKGVKNVLFDVYRSEIFNITCYP
jgi:hypothetical protein